MTRVAGRRPAVLVAAGLALTAVAGSLLLGGGGTDEARPAPTFVLEEVRDADRRVALDDRDGRPAVLNFFADWCEPCKEELPTFAEASRRYGDEVAFIGVDVRDSRSRAVDLLAASGVEYPAAFDPRGALEAPYRLQGLPVTVFVGADGRIVEEARGRLDAEDLDERVQRLLAEHA